MNAVAPLFARASLALLAAVSALLTGCEVVATSESLDATALHTVRGRVVGPDGLFADQVALVLYSMGADGKFVTVADVMSGFDGSYALQTYQVGKHRLVALRGGCDSVTTEFDVDAGTGSILIDFELDASTTTRVQGMLLDTEGRALSTSDIARLFPALAEHDESVASKGDDGVTEYFPFTGASRLVARFDHRGIPPRGEPEASVDVASGRFFCDVVPGFEGRLALDFRGREVVSVPWKDGDGLVEYAIDTDQLWSALGGLDIVQADDARFDRIVFERVDGPKGASRFAIDQPSFPLRLVGIPAGRYAVVAALGDSFTLREIDVADGTRAKVEIAREAGCVAEATFVDARQHAQPLTIDDLDLRTSDGVALPAAFQLKVVSGATIVRVTKASAGRFMLFAASAAVPIEFENDSIAKVNGRIEDLVDTHLQVKLHEGWQWKVPSAIPVRLRLRSHEGDLLADNDLRVTIDAEGFADILVAAPPGWYRARVDIADVKSYDTEIGPGVRTVTQRIDRDEIDVGR